MVEVFAQEMKKITYKVKEDNTNKNFKEINKYLKNGKKIKNLQTNS